MMAETNTEKRSIVEIKDITAGAGALGLLGYGMPGVLLGLANAGIIQAGSMIPQSAVKTRPRYYYSTERSLYNEPKT